MKKILGLALLISFHIFSVSCFRAESQTKTSSPAVKNESTQSVESKKQSVQDQPATLNYSQSRVEELMESLGLQRVRANTALMDFELADLKDQKHKLSAYKGKVIFLNFWATWCPPCKAEMPDMQKLNDKYKNKNFQMLAVNLQEPKDAVASYMEKKGFTFQVLLDTRAQAGRAYGASSIPLTLLIDKKGYLLCGAMGGRDWASPEAMELIDLLMNQPE